MITEKSPVKWSYPLNWNFTELQPYCDGLDFGTAFGNSLYQSNEIVLELDDACYQNTPQYKHIFSYTLYYYITYILYYYTTYILYKEIGAHSLRLHLAVVWYRSDWYKNSYPS